MTPSDLHVQTKASRILRRLQKYAEDGKHMFATSSFQTHSLPLLHIISRAQLGVDIVFLNTGYLFPETLQFRDHIARLLDLNLIDCRPSVPKSEQRTSNGRLLFAADPEKCCYLNKVAPLEPYLRQYDIWISGVRSEQTFTRSKLAEEQSAPYGTLRYHPMLTWNEGEVQKYRELHGLPEHPLDAEGYVSIGCMPCTIRHFRNSQDRSGRWHGQAKTECGLHTDLAEDLERKP